MKKETLIYIVVAVLLCVAGIFIGMRIAKSAPEKYIARVGKEYLTISRFYQTIPPEYLSQMTFEDKKQLVEQWVNQELLYYKAKKMGLDKEPDVRERLKEAMHAMLANEFLNRYIQDKIFVSPEELKAYYDSLKDELNIEIDAAQIVVKDLATAEEIYEKLKEGADFTEMVRKYSIEPFKQNDGFIGTVRRGELGDKTLEDALFRLNPGEISKPIKTVWGYHILKCLRKRKLKKKITFDDVKYKLEDMLRAEKAKRVLQSLLDSLKKKVKVEINYDLLH